MSVHASIREYLTKHMGQTFTARQIADAIGCELQPVAWGLNTMRSRGALIRETTGPRGHRYRMNPDWKPRVKLEGEKATKQIIYHNRWREKRRAAGLPRYRSPAELRKAEESRARADARRAEQAAKREKREVEKTERKERLTLERKSKLVAVVAKNAESRKPKVIKAAPAPQRTQTVEEFIASGGKVERLPIGAVAERMRA